MPPDNPYRNFLEAASFAARAHRDQVRKDGITPYAAHPFRVCLIVRHVFGIDDADFLTAALLHDTIEDTPTDYDDLAQKFGDRVAGWVGALSKDMRLPEAEREAAYIAKLTAAEPGVKIAKLADIFDNLTDSRHLSSTARQRAVARTGTYLAAIEQNLPEVARQPLAIVRQLFTEVAAQE